MTAVRHSLLFVCQVYCWTNEACLTFSAQRPLQTCPAGFLTTAIYLLLRSLIIAEGPPSGHPLSGVLAADSIHLPHHIIYVSCKICACVLATYISTSMLQRPKASLALLCRKLPPYICPESIHPPVPSYIYSHYNSQTQGTSSLLRSPQPSLRERR